MAGLQENDKIIEINDRKIASFMLAKSIINANAEKELSILIERNGTLQSVHVTPEKKVIDGLTEIGITGIVPKNIPHTVFSGIAAAFKTTYEFSIEFFKMLGRLITGGEDSSKLGGLGMIAKMSYDSWTGGIFALMGFMALLSLNLGLINLVPVPMLDGGHILLYIIEAIRGKPLSDKTLDIAFKIGLGAVLFLMIYGNWNDIKRYKIIEWIGSIFS
jgi:regulator of sigma E protease